jgi:signal transduction histidine kinase
MTQQRWLLLAIFAAVSLVATALLLDEQREFESALQNVRDEQIALATAVGADFETRLSALEEGGALHAASHVESMIPQLLGGALQLEQTGSRIILVARPDQDRLLTTRGRAIESKLLLSALHNRAAGVILPREEAPRFGLPPRIAIAGLETVHARSGTWGVVVMVSGQRLRARERHAQLRFLLGVSLVVVIVASFGGVAVRQQQRKLEVARALELSDFERERERLLARADKMATLAALSSGIAHEVATPLGTIMARIEQVLPANEHDPKASAALRVALEQVDRIQTIIRGVLGLARGEMPPLIPARPEAIARAAIALSKHRFAEAGIDIELAVQSDLSSVGCDPPMLEQALTNLLLNACDASTHGQVVRLTVEVDGATLRFVVSDEGEGVSVQTAARAQEPFFTTKPEGRGNGLGLAITREIVSHHGGQLRLEPRHPERGTRAIIELPCK